MIYQNIKTCDLIWLPKAQRPKGIMSTLKKPEKKTVERPREELEGALLPPGPAPAPISMDDLQMPSAVAIAVPVSSTDATSAAVTASSSAATTSAASAAAATIADIPTVAAVPVVAAVPMDYQDSSYPSQDAEEKEKMKKEKEAANRGTAAAAAGAPAATASESIPSAPYLPTCDESFEEGNRDYAESAAMLHANLNGKKNANEEMSDILMAKQKISTKTYNEKEAIREAAAEAKRRNRSGVQIKEDKWFQHKDTKPAYKEGNPDDDKYAKKKGGGYEVSEYQSTYEEKEYETKDYETSEYKSVYD